MKKLAVKILLLGLIITGALTSEVLLSISLNASRLDSSCTDGILNSTPNVTAGNGGQDYISSVWFSMYSSATSSPHSFAFDADIYDWNGKYIYTLEGDSSQPSAEPMEATGLVDGTYTYVINDMIGTFNVNHNIENEVVIDDAELSECSNIQSDQDITPAVGTSLNEINNQENVDEDIVDTKIATDDNETAVIQKIIEDVKTIIHDITNFIEMLIN